eukprot:TRINITY_DN12788_c0_g1_i1.p1 TRINITY_DN12788_c0_g1~~TRINITY_DN12788_c0_g1_i1.p1  ORF type:complete len:610 (+),score=118.10 TRINITY_DN12788_c0_g1_i1:39-1868(+)
MGNNTSSLPDSVIDDSPILTTQDWSLHHAESTDHGPLSVFIGQKTSQDSNLLLLAKGLKQYRHPSILKYYACAPNVGQIYLFTEKVCPLSLVRTQQNPFSTGLGIFQVCQAIKFLHETGRVTHGNINENCLFVTPSGEWKLSGLDNVQLISQAPANSSENRDILALGILITELLSRFTDRESQEFNEFAKSNLLLPDLSRRPSISQILAQPYFQQDYILILQYLKDLTLKSENDKEEFFSTIGDRLMSIPQQVLGQHFAKPLLSRYVMMDFTAREKLVPRILQPESVHPDAIFSDEYFSEYVVPEVKTLFLVYDSGIRLILLENFSSFCKSIDTATLEEDILPALLLGLKDTSPLIVSQTLRSLADIVPILGPEKVIGKNTSRIFCDGSPSRRINKESYNISWKPQPMGGAQAHSSEGENLPRTILPTSHVIKSFDDHRFPPVGAETEEEDLRLEESANNLEEWDNWGEEATSGDDQDNIGDNALNQITLSSIPPPSNKPVIVVESKKLQDDGDVPNLDGKMQLRPLQSQQPLLPQLAAAKDVEAKEELDFFADMTPDIPTQTSVLDKIEKAISNKKMEKFAAVLDDRDECQGWGEEEEGQGGWTDDGW